MRQPGSALCCCCLALCLAASASGRGLLITDQQAQKALDTVTSAAGDIWGQASQALDSSSLADGTMSPWQRNHTIEAINHRAPEFITDWGYVIRPQVSPPTPNVILTLAHPVGFSHAHCPLHMQAAQIVPKASIRCNVLQQSVCEGCPLLQEVLSVSMTASCCMCRLPARFTMQRMGGGQSTHHS